LDNRAIGVFDSGVGGLTVLREIIKEVPGESTIYFGDTKRFPYGPRDIEQVRGFVISAAEFLQQNDIKMMVIACNTGSVAALDHLKEKLKIPVIGVIKPGARTAVKNTKNRRVGVIATEATVKSGAYEREIKKLDPGIKVYSVAAPLLIDYIENGILQGKELEAIIRQYIGPLLSKDIDVLVLGCTHFPLVERQILAVSGNGIRVISSAVETAKDVKKILIEKELSADAESRVKRTFYETSLNSNFFKTGQIFLGAEIGKVIKVESGI
jgi:glutamate racemase